jgi:CelD/BcsL family acetyltransferase involved in cellulose biosynthesis
MPPSEGRGLSVREIGHYDAFLALRDDWNALAGGRSVFLRHEWFDAAWQWRRLEEGTRLLILGAYRGERLAGALPLVRRIVRARGVTQRALEFLTVPDVQLCDLIVADGEGIGVSSAFAAELHRRAGSWDALRLTHLPEESIAAGTLAHALRAEGIGAVCARWGGNPFIDLTTGWDAYYAARSRSVKKSINLAANRLRKCGEVGVSWLQPGQRDGVTAAVERIADISARSWKIETGNSLNYPGPVAFIRRLSALAAEQGWLSVWELNVGQRPVAMEYQLVFDGKVHALRSDFDAAFQEMSPGANLNRHLLETLFSASLRRYYLGPGDNPYKARWTDVAEPLFSLTAFSPSLRGRTLAAVETRLKPLVRSLRQRFASSRSGEPEGRG